MDKHALMDILKRHLTLEVHPRSNDPEDDTMRLTMLFDGEDVAAVDLPTWARDG